MASDSADSILEHSGGNGDGLCPREGECFGGDAGGTADGAGGSRRREAAVRASGSAARGAGSLHEWVCTDALARARLAAGVPFLRGDGLAWGGCARWWLLAGNGGAGTGEFARGRGSGGAGRHSAGQGRLPVWSHASPGRSALTSWLKIHV